MHVIVTQRWDYLNEYSVVGFAEQVHNEIVKFQSNNDKFSYIYNKYVANQTSYEILKLAI